MTHTNPGGMSHKCNVAFFASYAFSWPRSILCASWSYRRNTLQKADKSSVNELTTYLVKTTFAAVYAAHEMRPALVGGLLLFFGMKSMALKHRLSLCTVACAAFLAFGHDASAVSVGDSHELGFLLARRTKR
jgi:hypothetical protein